MGGKYWAETALRRPSPNGTNFVNPHMAQDVLVCNVVRLGAACAKTGKDLVALAKSPLSLTRLDFGFEIATSDATLLEQVGALTLFGLFLQRSWPGG